MRSVLSDSFQSELERASSRLRESIAPYKRFVLAEDERLHETRDLLRVNVDHLEQLKIELGGD
jgi:hypothetical protein